MNFIKAYEAMYDEENVRLSYWDNDKYIYLEDGQIFDEKDEYYAFSKSEIRDENWEIYEPEEKEDMIELNGRKYSRSTLIEALKHYVNH